MEGLFRTSNPCKAGLVVGALRTVCARLPDSILLKKTLDIFRSATRGSIAFGITTDVPPVSNPYVPSGLAPANAFHSLRSSTRFFSKWLSVATDFAKWVLGSSTLLTLHTTCKEPTLARVSVSARFCTGESK